MKTITFTATDRKGIELKDGDIIKSDFGVNTVVFFNEKKRCYLAYDEAPFPVSISEEDIAKYFDIIGHISNQPDFKPVYEADIVRAEIKPKKSIWNLIFK